MISSFLSIGKESLELSTLNTKIFIVIFVSDTLPITECCMLCLDYHRLSSQKMFVGMVRISVNLIDGYEFETGRDVSPGNEADNSKTEKMHNIFCG